MAQPKQIEEHTEAAKQLVEMSPKELNEQCPVLVDLMSNEANEKYGALPDRLYVIQNGKVMYDGGQGPFGYNLDKLEEWLNLNS